MVKLQIFPKSDTRMFSTSLKTCSGFADVEIKYIPGTEPILISVRAIHLGHNAKEFITPLVNRNEKMLSEIMQCICDYEMLLKQWDEEVYGEESETEQEFFND